MALGIAGLEGAREVSPGTGIYYGGEHDAVEGVVTCSCACVMYILCMCTVRIYRVYVQCSVIVCVLSVHTWMCVAFVWI